jgi:hypothetical protein
MKKKKKLSIDEYIEISKGDIYVYIIITIILFLILLYISYKKDSYYILLFELVMLIQSIERIETYYTLKKIKTYLFENNLIDKIGNIDYWNERYYFLTENYMIIKRKKSIYSFKYSEIVNIFKEKKLENRRIYEYLHIITNNNEFRVLIYSSVLVDEDYKDISNYLINKNPNLKINETTNKNV